MKNILFYFPTPFNAKRGGGIERTTDKIVRGLLAYGYRVYYLHLKNEEIFDNGFLYPVKMFFLPSDNLLDLENILFYQKILKEYNIDIVINQQGLYEGIYLVDQIGDCNVKIMSVLHSNPIYDYDYVWENIKSLRNRTFKEYVKRIFRCLLYFRIKNNERQIIKEHYNYLLSSKQSICILSKNYLDIINRIDKKLLKKTIVIPNPNTYDSISSIPLKEPILLFVGRLDNRSKKLLILIDIWRKLYKLYPQWKLIIVGDGPDKDLLVSMAKKIPRIEFVGYEDPFSYYEKASIFCLTSLFEGFPMCLTEAMQLGCVPIAFDSFAAVHDVIKPGETGELVKAFDKKAYIDKLKYLMSDDAYRNILSKNAFEYVKKYDISNILPMWIDLIEK